MRGLWRVGLVATFSLVSAVACEETERPTLGHSHDDPEDLDDEDRDDDYDDEYHYDDEDHQDDGEDAPSDDEDAPSDDADEDDDAPSDEEDAPSDDVVVSTQRTQVPDEIVGTWNDGAFDFATWESYREQTWCGRSAAPTREAMVFEQSGDATYYRYECLYNFYEKLEEAEGTVAFHDDGTFTFAPRAGRRRYFEWRRSEANEDRPLTAAELVDPDLAGTRKYAYDGTTTPVTMRITVPSSAPYNWYKQR